MANSPGNLAGRTADRATRYTQSGRGCADVMGVVGASDEGAAQEPAEHEAATAESSAKVAPRPDVRLCMTQPGTSRFAPIAKWLALGH